MDKREILKWLNLNIWREKYQVSDDDMEIFQEIKRIIDGDFERRYGELVETVCKRTDQHKETP